MDKDLSCKVCEKSFKFQLLKEFHLDTIHNFIFYKCEICGKIISDNLKQSSFHHLLHHLYKYHDQIIYVILDHLNLY